MEMPEMQERNKVLPGQIGGLPIRDDKGFLAVYRALDGKTPQLTSGNTLYMHCK